MNRLDVLQTRKLLHRSTVSHLQIYGVPRPELTFSVALSSAGSRSVTKKGASYQYPQILQPIDRSRPMATIAVRPTSNAGDKLVNRLAHSTSPYVRSSSTS